MLTGTAWRKLERGKIGLLVNVNWSAFLHEQDDRQLNRVGLRQIRNIRKLIFWRIEVELKLVNFSRLPSPPGNLIAKATRLLRPILLSKCTWSLPLLRFLSTGVRHVLWWSGHVRSWKILQPVRWAGCLRRFGEGETLVSFSPDLPLVYWHTCRGRIFSGLFKADNVAGRTAFLKFEKTSLTASTRACN